MRGSRSIGLVGVLSISLLMLGCGSSPVVSPVDWGDALGPAIPGQGEGTSSANSSEGSISDDAPSGNPPPLIEDLADWDQTIGSSGNNDVTDVQLPPTAEIDSEIKPILVSETANAFVVHIPIVTSAKAGTLADSIMDGLQSIGSPAWGSGNAGFGIEAMNLSDPIQRELERFEAGIPAVGQLYLKALDSVHSVLLGSDAQLSAAAGSASVGVLPIVALNPDSPVYGDLQGLELNVGLWSQQATCGQCPFQAATLQRAASVVLLSSGEIADLLMADRVDGYVNWVIPKAGIWWAQSTAGATPVRNWFSIEVDGGNALTVECLTSAGVWP